jgi:hypothetical protein
MEYDTQPKAIKFQALAQKIQLKNLDLIFLGAGAENL